MRTTAALLAAGPQRHAGRKKVAPRRSVNGGSRLFTQEAHVQRAVRWTNGSFSEVRRPE
jgi:hypothetical protein